MYPKCIKLNYISNANILQDLKNLSWNLSSNYKNVVKTDDVSV